MLYQGYYKCKHPERYKGNPTQIVYRSGWELRMMHYLDSHPDVLYWQNEEVVVPYRSVIDGQVHRYYPDFVVKMRDSTGKVKTVMLEVKPHAQTVPPKPSEKKTKKYITEVHTYGVNQSKWKAAQEYCKDRGWEFRIITEEHVPAWKGKK